MVEVELVEGLTIVSLRVAHGQAAEVAASYELAEPLLRTYGDPASFWVGPDSWLFVSEHQSTEAIIGACEKHLEEQTWNAVNSSDAFQVLRISGDGVRETLSSGSGLDFRLGSFVVGACKRTRFAQIQVTIVAIEEDTFELMFDRSYADYLRAWLASTISSRTAC